MSLCRALFSSSEMAPTSPPRTSRWREFWANSRFRNCRDTEARHSTVKMPMFFLLGHPLATFDDVAKSDYVSLNNAYILTFTLRAKISCCSSSWTLPSLSFSLSLSFSFSLSLSFSFSLSLSSSSLSLSLSLSWVCNPSQDWEGGGREKNGLVQHLCQS